MDEYTDRLIELYLGGQAGQAFELAAALDRSEWAELLAAHTQLEMLLRLSSAGGGVSNAIYSAAKGRLAAAVEETCGAIVLDEVSDGFGGIFVHHLEIRRCNRALFPGLFDYRAIPPYLWTDRVKLAQKRRQLDAERLGLEQKRCQLDAERLGLEQNRGTPPGRVKNFNLSKWSEKHR